MSHTKRDELILAALLHDIGKFMQRADAEIRYRHDGSMAHNILPKDFDTSRPTHHHALYTADFFDGMEEQAKRSGVAAETWKNAGNRACKHHSPDTAGEWIIAEADRLSSGMDRKPRDEEAEASAEGWREFRRIRLRSVFAELDLGRGKPEAAHYRIAKLDRAEAAMPGVETAKDDETQGEYARLWPAFVSDFESIPSCPPEQRLLALDALLLHYTWAIPSSTMDQPDISLYDHSRTTAAIAAALYEYHRQKDSLSAEAIRDRAIEKYRLIGGDLSGIQGYIFRLSHDRSRGAAKILRARSFYLSALTLAAIRLICRRCGLSPFCVLIDAGGRFTLLAPNLDSVREGLKKARQEIDRWLFGRFFGQLRLNLTDETTLTGQDFFGRFGDKMRELNDALDRAKRQPWSGQIQSEGQWRRGAFAFDDGYPYGETVCPISGYGRPEVEWPTGEGQTIKVSRQTAQERRIGEELARAKAIEISEAGGPDSVAFFENEARTFLRIHSRLPDLANSASGGELYALNELAPGFGCRVIANHVPRLTRELRERFAEQGLEDDELASSEIGDALTFEQIAALAAEKVPDSDWIGARMLGILKADVDNLGLLMSQGLGADQSASRHAGLARMLHFFFAGHLGHMLEADPGGMGFKDVYTIFAGGDDLLLVGPWNAAICLARALRNDFRRFTARNANITLSAAVSLMRPRQPIRGGAEEAEEELEKAKTAGKNRLRLFQTDCRWGKEIQQLMEFGDWLSKQARDPKSNITKGFVYRLLSYYRDFLRFQHNHDPRAGLYRSHLRYDIGRNIDKRKKPDDPPSAETAKLLEALADAPEPTPILAKLKVPVFWALYRNRGGK